MKEALKLIEDVGYWIETLDAAKSKEFATESAVKYSRYVWKLLFYRVGGKVWNQTFADLNQLHQQLKTVSN